MTQVIVLKQWGFEQVGSSVDYRGADLDQRIAEGYVEVVGQPTITPVEEPVAEEVTPEEEPVQPIQEVAPVVETPVEEVPEKITEITPEVEGQ